MKTPAEIREAAATLVNLTGDGFTVVRRGPEYAQVIFLAEIAAQLCHHNDFVENEIREQNHLLRAIKTAVEGLAGKVK